MKILINTFLTLLLWGNSEAFSFGFDHQYKNYEQVLKAGHYYNKKQALFNYTKIKNNPTLLNKVLTSFSSVKMEEFKKFSKKKRLAFLINAYNVYTIKLIVDNPGTKSIKDLGSIFKSTWKKKFFFFLGKKRHLDDIEHNLIRKNFNEPRIHFAVVCASISCPNLIELPYVYEKLEMQLETSAQLFLKDSTKNSLNKKDLKLELSKIFKWYGDDFNKTYGSYQGFIAKRITKKPDLQKMILENKLKIKWKKYNWKLNQ